MGEVCRINTSPGSRAKGFAVCVPAGIVRCLSASSLMVISLSSCQSNWKSLWKSWQCVQISILPCTVSGCFFRFTSEIPTTSFSPPALAALLLLQHFLASKTQIWRDYLVFLSRDEGLQLCCGPWLCCTLYITVLEEAHTVPVFQSLSPSCPTLLSWSHTVRIIQFLISDSSAKATPELYSQELWHQ